jgi:hypothetical protein
MRTKDLPMYILGGLITLCFFIVLYLLIINPIPIDNRDVLYLIIGALIGFEGAIVNYYYGSSKGSADKNDLIKKTEPEPPTPPIKP